MHINKSSGHFLQDTINMYLTRTSQSTRRDVTSRDKSDANVVGRQDNWRIIEGTHVVQRNAQAAIYNLTYHACWKNKAIM